MKYIKTMTLVFAAALLAAGCSTDKPSETADSTAAVEQISTPTPSLTPTNTPTPTPLPNEKIDWKKALYIEDDWNYGCYALTSDMNDNRRAYKLELNEHLLSSIDNSLLTGEQKEHYYAFCDALWSYGSETPCKDEEEWKLLNKLAAIYHPMISFTDSKTYKDMGNGKAGISYKISQDEYEKKIFDLKVRLNELVLHSDLREDDPNVVKALKLLIGISPECVYDGSEKRHYMYDTAMTGEGVCSDYAKLYTYICLQCGVDAEYISGGIWETNSHALTAIKGEGDSYYLGDLTWEATFSHYPRFFGEVIAPGGKSEGPYFDLVVKRVGASGLYDPKDFKIDFEGYRDLTWCLWVGYNCIDNNIEYIDERAAEFSQGNDSSAPLRKVFDNPGKKMKTLKVLPD